MSRDGTTAASRTVTVIPTGSEVGLRQWDWVERNQEYVERKSGGKVAYVYLPDTADNGYTFFNRMFFAQSRQATPSSSTTAATAAARRPTTFSKC